MPKRDTPSDLDEYLPDEAAIAEIMAEPDETNNVDPELVAKLRRLGTNPNLLRVAPESVRAYVPPTEVPGPAEDEKTVPRAEAKVKLAVPPSTRDLPTMPSLRRLQGEPDLPGVVKGPSTGQRISVRTATLAVLTVFVPVLLVILVMGHWTHHDDPNGAVASGAPSNSVTPNVPAPPAPSTPPLAPTRPPLAATIAAPVASANPSAPPPTSAAAPMPTGAAQRRRPRGAPDDPYDTAPQATAAPSMTAAPTAAPTVVPPVQTSAPSVAPTLAPTAPSATPSSTKPGPAGGDRVKFGTDHATQ